MAKTIIESSNEDFTRMYEESFSGFASFKPGQAVETTILSISKDTVFIQVSGKSEGLIEKDEFKNKDGEITVKVGDSIAAYFLHAKNGELYFTTKIGKDKAGPEMLEQAFKNQIPVEGMVEKEIKGGFEVKIGEVRAFCPYSQMGPRRSESPDQYVGTNQTFRIVEYRENGRNILVSNRVIHEEAYQAKLESLKKTIVVDAVVTGVIASIQDYGAFVDLGGVQALLPVSEIGRTRVEDIRAALKVGQSIEAQVIKVDWNQEKISLSLKNLMADPWNEAIAKYPLDSKHLGKVARITNFGAFVTLEPGIDGLIHISELRTPGTYGNSKEVTVKLGQTLSVQVVGIDAGSKRISLKQTSTLEEDAVTNQYLNAKDDNTTYNPFAALLKKK